MKMNAVKYAILGLSLNFLSVEVIAEDVVSISTTVKGNQEHPGVTYIVPWRQAADESALTMEFKTRTRLTDIFDQVEREEHEREVNYLVQMQRNDEPSDALNDEAAQ